MSSQVIFSSKLPSTNHDSMSNENRRTANFHPCVWGDMFLSFSPEVIIDATTQRQYEELKQDVRMMIKVPMDELLHKLRLIDTIKRLGMSYHFEREIKDALQNIYYHDYKDDQSLEATSLLFRLLRENGFDVQSETFKKFKDDEGNFKMSLTSDVKGLLELFEASHLRVHGEEILEEALAFTTTHLELAKATIIKYPLLALVSHALKQSIQRGFPRVEAWQFISIYEDNDSHDKKLLKFAKLDFNLLQNSHREELSKISRWWKDLDFARKLPFARDRLVECYFWKLGVYFEPQYFLAGEIFTKVAAMASMMNDIYDAFGTFEELELLTKAIQRWDAACIHQLPEYMKLFYKALIDTYEKVEEMMTKQGKLYRVQYMKETMKQLSQSYFVEAKWYHENYVPTMEEYMSNAIASGACIMSIVTAFVGMGDMVTPHIFDWASKSPKIITASCIICRLMNDIVSHKFEQERGHVASAVECYMKEHGVSEEEACTELKKQVENAWKDINQELFVSKAAPMPVLTRILNLTRAIDFFYKKEDGYTHVGKDTKAAISSLLIDPIRISSSGN